MKDLYAILLEGGASGHMAHPYDYDDYTLRDIKGLIRNLFLGRIDDITEKLDGTNIQATVNPKGEVVFIRNKGDINSEQGGMTITDMQSKWSDNKRIADIFVSAGEKIKQVFANIPVKFFNPDKNTKIIVNCECITAGKTNILPYASSQVDFHNLWVYKFNGTEWEKFDVTKDGLDIIKSACEKVDGAYITPNVMIKVFNDSQKLLVKYIKDIDSIFKEAGCKEYSTIEDYKKSRFREYCKNNEPWIFNSSAGKGGITVLYNRLFNGDKNVNIKQIKMMYNGEYNDNITALDKNKKVIYYCIEPIETFFAKLGNDIIALCDNLINKGNETEVISVLKSDMKDVISAVKSGDNEELKDKLNTQLERLSKLGNEINATEGIVFNYKGKLQKLTGSFAALNQILGSIKFNS